MADLGYTNVHSYGMSGNLLFTARGVAKSSGTATIRPS